TQKPDVGQQLQLQAQGTLFSGSAIGRLAWCPVSTGLEASIAQSVKPALGHFQNLTRLCQVSQHLTGVIIDHRGAHGHLQSDIRTLCTGTVTAHAVLAIFCPVAALVPIVDQSVDAFIRHQKHRAAITAIAPTGAAHRNELLAAKSQAAVSALAGLHVNLGFINKFHGVFLPEDPASALPHAGPNTAAKYISEPLNQKRVQQTKKAPKPELFS